MTTEIILKGALADDFLEYLDERKETLTGIKYHGEFKDSDPEKAGTMELTQLILDFVKDVGVELLATLIVDFITKKLSEPVEIIEERQETQNRELKIVNDNIDFYAKNYSKEEVIDILESIPKKTTQTMVIVKTEKLS
jgi:hypothetical protein